MKKSLVLSLTEMTCTRMYTENPEVGRPLEDLGTDRRAILKPI
jgi:hypothetical protein